jgi:predicted branched-subunit amino acid permease
MVAADMPGCLAMLMSVLVHAGSSKLAASHRITSGGPLAITIIATGRLALHFFGYLAK